jgi:hypothetical protein
LIRNFKDTITKKGGYMTKFFAFLVTVFAFLLSSSVPAQTTIIPCSDCQPAVADTWPHNTGKYGAGTRNIYLHNRWHKDLTVHANGNGSGTSWTNLTFTLKIGRDTIIQVPNKWGSARIWGQWDPTYVVPFTLFEMTLHAGWGCDWYNVSLVDGYNLPGIFKPVPGTFVAGNPQNLPTEGRPAEYTCGVGGCTTDLYLTAPASMLKLAANGDTNGIYCNDNAECRTLKKTACPKSYSWAFDDPTSLFTCPSAHINDAASAIGPDYIIYFGLPPTSPDINNNKPTINYTFIDAMTVTMTRRGELKSAYGGRANARLSLHSCNGKLMTEIVLTEPSGTVRVPGLARGFYLVTLTTDRAVKTARMMVAR